MCRCDLPLIILAVWTVTKPVCSYTRNKLACDKLAFDYLVWDVCGKLAGLLWKTQQSGGPMSVCITWSKLP